MNYIDILKEWKIHLMIILLLFSVISIDLFRETQGVEIKTVLSPASVSVQAGDILINMNGISINNSVDYYEAFSTIQPGDIVRIDFKRSTGLGYAIQSAYPFVAEERNNETYLGLVVSDISSSNLNFGLDIVGGTKVLLQPERLLEAVEVENIMAILNQRLNVYGLQEIPVSYQQDLSGNQYFRLEFAGASEQEVRDLLEKEGKFEAKIMNETVITGVDILDVCITGTQCIVRIEPVDSVDGGFMWNFIFQIDLSQEAAQRFANATDKLDTGECDISGCYLNATIDFYMDNEPIEGSQLRISSDLQGKEITNPVISGTRFTKLEAEQEMRSMQAILQSGELPVKMNVVRTESISPELGMNFAQNVFLVFFIAIIAVDLIIAIRYRNWKIVIPIVIVSFSEILITLGVSAAMSWTLDFAAIAGLIAAIGTGVGDQIIITDEILRGEKRDDTSSIKKRIGRAFFIIVATFTCTIATMLPLMFAGAGLLRGFAITTVIATSTGIFVTRPAFARILEIILK